MNAASRHRTTASGTVCKILRRFYDCDGTQWTYQAINGVSWSHERPATVVIARQKASRTWWRTTVQIKTWAWVSRSSRDIYGSVRSMMTDCCVIISSPEIERGRVLSQSSYIAVATVRNTTTVSITDQSWTDLYCEILRFLFRNVSRTRHSKQEKWTTVIQRRCLKFPWRSSFWPQMACGCSEFVAQWWKCWGIEDMKFRTPSSDGLRNSFGPPLAQRQIATRWTSAQANVQTRTTE